MPDIPVPIAPLEDCAPPPPPPDDVTDNKVIGCKNVAVGIADGDDVESYTACPPPPPAAVIVLLLIVIEEFLPTVPVTLLFWTIIPPFPTSIL